MPVLATAFSLFCLEALRALGRNKLRSALAALAIMIGVAAVVCVVAIGRDMPLIKRVTPNVDGRAQIVFGNKN